MSVVTPPDISQLSGQSLPTGKFPSQRGAEFRVHFAPEVYRAMLAHAAEDLGVEVCGVLVGRIERDDEGPFAVITASIRGEAAANKFTEVTFTHETWNQINQQMDQKYADRAIVGWYHTHPNFGIFLSDRDRFIHEHFFNGPGQVALVIDPVRKIEGVFRWKRGKPVPCERFWIGDELRFEPAESRVSQQEPPETSAAPAAAPAPRPSNAGSDWVTALLTLLLAGLAFVTGNLYAAQKTQAEQARLTEAFAVSWAQLHLLRPGLSEAMDTIRDQMEAARQATLVLLQPPAKNSPEQDKARQERAEQLLREMEVLQQKAVQIKAIYGLTPAQTEAVKDAMARSFAPVYTVPAPGGSDEAPAAPTRTQTKPDPNPAALTPPETKPPSKSAAQPAEAH